MDTAYLICFGVGLLFALVSAFFADVFGGHAMPGHVSAPHAEAGYGSHDMPGFSPLSPTTIATFITGFGGFGMLFERWPATRGPLISAPLAVLAGLLTAMGVFILFRKIFAITQCSSEAKISELIGTAATIVTPIPAQGVGEIAYVMKGSRYTAPARSEDGMPTASGASVRVTRVVGAQCYVRTE
jgi:membrane protein implicated in regulation of membrane protease activity